MTKSVGGTSSTSDVFTVGRGARIGPYGRYVHGLDDLGIYGCSTGRPYYHGTSLCGRWSGEARLTDEPVTCPACRRRMQA